MPQQVHESMGDEEDEPDEMEEGGDQGGLQALIEMA